MENVTCYRETPHLTTLFYFVSVFGGIVAVLSIAFNLILLQAFLARPFYRQHSFVYFIALAVADILLSLLYILLFSNSFLWEYLQIAWLFKFWHYSLRYVFPFSHIVQCIIPYFLVVATIERYLSNVFRVTFSSRNRLAAIFGVILFSIASKVTTYWEIELAYEPNCTGIGSIYPDLGPFARNEHYNVIFIFWYRNIVSVFAPFIILLALNLRLMAKDFCAPILRLGCVKAIRNCCRRKLCWEKNLHHQHSTVRTLCPQGAVRGKTSLLDAKASIWARRARARVRKASTRTLIAIVIEYLLCHSATFVVTAWEHIDMKSLREQYKDSYLILVEVINFLNLFASTIRLPTYLYCDVTFRKEFSRRVRKVYSVFIGPFRAAPVQRTNGYCNSEGRAFETIVMEAIAKKKLLDKPNLERLL